jgi:rare lipoprotein A
MSSGYRFAQARFLPHTFLVAAIVWMSTEAFPADGADPLSGIASVYDQSSGAETASGEPLRDDAMTAAHRTLPFGTMVRVTSRQTGRVAIVRINDRGPFVRGRVIDLALAAGRALGLSGLAEVSLEIVGSDGEEHSRPITVSTRMD